MNRHMAEFYALLWIEGFIYIAEGLAIIVSFGHWQPSWIARYGYWMMMRDN